MRVGLLHGGIHPLLLGPKGLALKDETGRKGQHSTAQAGREGKKNLDRVDREGG
jgi:hypothetical protein